MNVDELETFPCQACMISQIVQVKSCHQLIVELGKCDQRKQEKQKADTKVGMIAVEDEQSEKVPAAKGVSECDTRPNRIDDRWASE